MFLKPIVRFFTSLKLTVTLLAFAIALVFIGTLAQADEGLYGAQAHYFKQWIVIGANLFGHKVPLILPGGYLIGVTLLVNLICAHIYRFQLTTKKLGIQLAHLGVILLLVGQLATDLLSHEMQINFSEGETRNYSDSTSDYELIFICNGQVTAIPQSLLKVGETLRISSLPFDIKVKSFWKNSDVIFRAPMMKNGPPITSNGVALSFDFQPAPDVKTTDRKNVPTAIIELVGPKMSYGEWVASDWNGDVPMAQVVQESYTEQLGPQMAAMAQQIAVDLIKPQSIEVDGKTYTFTIRPARVPQPFSLTLLKATHTTYIGSISSAEPQGIPKDFRSRVRLENPATGEKREVEISMNHPLRYGGLTFYQYQMTAGEMVDRAGQTPSSVLQVVHNPSWLTPYIGCGMVALGLVVQFLSHLTSFMSRKKTK
jgi:hypothetical protein